MKGIKTMKAIKKLLALSLILVMVLTMMPTAMAAGECSLTMTGENTAVEYTVYKMFAVEYTSAGTDSYKYEVTTVWEDFAGYSVGNAKVSDLIEYNNGYVFGKKNPVSAVDGAALAELAKSYVTNKNSDSDDANNIASVGTIKAGGTLTGLDNGYYLLASSDKSASGVVMLANDTTDNKAKTIKVKTEAEGLPNVEKLVLEDTLDAYNTTNSVDVGEIITFKTTIKAAAGARNYVLHDIMDEHMELVVGSGTFTRDGVTMTIGTDYNVNYEPECAEGCRFHIEFTESLCSSLSDSAVLVIHYNAKLKPNTSTESLANHAHTNTSFLTYSDSSRSGTSTTETYTYDVVINKIDNKNNPVVGAGFILRDVDNKYYKWNAETYAVEWVDEANATMVYSEMSGANALAIFKGVDAENFTIIEKVVPDGYTGTTDVAVSTKNHGDPKNGKATITNTLGNALPETGGIGTTVFYVVGGCLVLAALVILLMKKRSVTE